MPLISAALMAVVRTVPADIEASCTPPWALMNRIAATPADSEEPDMIAAIASRKRCLALKGIRSGRGRTRQ